MRFLKRPSTPSLILLVLALGLNVALAPQLLNLSSLAAVFYSFLPLILLAAGQTIIVLVGGIDLSMGALVTLVSVTVVTRFGGAPVVRDIPTALAAGMAVGLISGAVNGLCITVLRLQPIITTFATSFLWSGLALWVLPRPGGAVPDFYTSTWHAASVTPFLVIALLIALWTIFRRTRGARFLYAAGGDPIASFASGLPVDRLRVLCYVTGGCFAALAAFAIVAETGTGDPLIGQPLTLPSITAVVLGGTALAGGWGSLEGSVFGAILLALFRNIIFFLGVPSQVQTLVEGSIIMLALAGPSLAARAFGRQS